MRNNWLAHDFFFIFFDVNVFLFHQKIICLFYLEKNQTRNDDRMLVGILCGYNVKVKQRRRKSGGCFLYSRALIRFFRRLHLSKTVLCIKYIQVYLRLVYIIKEVIEFKHCTDIKELDMLLKNLQSYTFFKLIKINHVFESWFMICLINFFLLRNLAFLTANSGELFFSYINYWL